MMRFSRVMVAVLVLPSLAYGLGTKEIDQLSSEATSAFKDSLRSPKNAAAQLVRLADAALYPALFAYMCKVIHDRHLKVHLDASGPLKAVENANRYAGLASRAAIAVIAGRLVYECARRVVNHECVSDFIHQNAPNAAAALDLLQSEADAALG